MIFGDYGSTCGSTSETLSGATLVGDAPGPWTSLGSSSGGHTGPTWSYVLDTWVPDGEGDLLEWQIRATNLVDPAGNFYWSSIYGATTFNCVTIIPADEDGDGYWEDYCDIADWGDEDGIDADGDGVIDNCQLGAPVECDGPDEDGDGVCDDEDICPGHDDRIDTDRDGVPDGCDPCPLDPLDDSDGDGVCDSDDICPGHDDNIDTDGDGVPDGCDPCPLDPLDDSDGDGVCDSDDLCRGDDATGDSDGDGVCDDLDACVGDDATGDADGDGFCADVDCDDSDPDTYPGAPEICDGKDNNCDGSLPADEQDADGDGVMACEGDCDDDNADIYPGAPELCDGLDNDCDGVIPDDELDLDGDGEMACEGDCDDLNNAVNSMATEICDDGMDNDCNGLVDIADPACAEGDPGDGGADDADPEVVDEGGCGCAAGAQPVGAAWGLLLALGALIRRRRS